MSGLLERELRDGFTQTGNVLSVWKVKSLWPFSVDEFQDLPIQSGQVLKAKNFKRCCILLVPCRTGWPDTYVRGMTQLPRILSGYQRARIEQGTVSISNMENLRAFSKVAGDIVWINLFLSKELQK